MARHLEEPMGLKWWQKVLLLAWIGIMLFGALTLLTDIRGPYAPSGHVPTAVANPPATALDLPRATPKPTASPRPSPSPIPTQPRVYFHDCQDAADADALPLRKGDDGYRSGLDTDRDGKACENFG